MEWRRIGLMAAAGCMAWTAVLAGPAGHYVSGVEGLKAASLPPPGRYYRMYNLYYQADTMRDADGNRLDIGFDLKVFANVHRVIWVFDTEVLGGNLFMDALIPFVYTDLKVEALGLRDDRWGVGDPFIEPLGVKWNGARYDAAVAAGLYLPLGTYDADRPASAGKDMWTLMLTAGGSWYIDAGKTWAASVLGRFETHSTQDDLDVRPGNSLHFEYGVSKAINPGLDLGVAGYCHWQVSDAKGDDGNRDRMFAVGPEVSLFLPRQVMFVSLRGLTQFGVRGREEGNLATLTLTKPF